MPSLLSPRGATTKAPTEDDSIVKKPIGVMGRLKSTFKLGRRKSSSGSASSSAAAAATAMALDDKNDEPAVNNDDDEEKARNDQEDDVLETFTVEKDEIKPFTTVDDDNEAKPEVNLDDKNDRVATFELSTAESTPMDENEEVFACDYSSGQGPHVDDATLHDDEEVDDHFDRPGAPDDSDRNTNSGNQSRDVGAPPESDLMIVGVSPTKLPAPVTGPSLSPVKRSQPPREKEQTPAPMGNQDPPTGPSQVDTEPSLGDRVTSAHSTRPIRQLSDSPVRRLQLLSDFQFGTDGTTATTSPAPLSPMKRRAQAAASLSSSLPTRRSFQREHEGHPSINATHPTAASPSPAASPAKAQRKPDTPSTMPSVRAVRSERRSALHGITEEDTEATLRPRPAGGSRRRGASMEAPFLASSFVATPEVPEDPSTVMENEQPEAAVPHDKPLASTTEDETGPGAFAFDAGAAITTVFGERVARLLGADPWGDRQDGFDAIVYQLKKTDLATAKNRRELFCAALAAVQCGVDDRVAPVMYCALDTLRSILKEFATILDRSFLKYQPTNEQLSGLTKAIIGKLGDSNKRTQREASQAIVRLAKLKKLKVLPHVLLHLSAKEVVPRQRVETLRLLVKELGTEPSTALNVEVVMQFAVPVLKIAEEKTRKAAVELIAELHLIHDQAVNAQLTGVKPEMLRVINRRVDELLTQRESERQAQQAQQTTSANQEDDRTTTMALVAVPVEDTAAVQTLLESMHTQAQGVVGPVVWRKLESKTWSDRKEALVDVEKTITEAKSDLRDVKPTFQSIVQHNFIAYCTVVHRCLSDGIAPVVNSAMDTFVTLMKIYGPCVEWREDTVQDLTLLTIVRLFGTMQKPNTRTNRAACRCLLKLARLHSPHPLRYVVSCVFAKDTDPLVQMHLLRLLIPEFGFQSEGLSPHDVLGLVATALNHSNDKVRKTATDVALCTQRLVGKDTVLQKLTDVVKPVTLKELEKQFVEVEIQKDTDRPQTVHATTLPPVQLNGERRLLNSAPVGVGKLQCTPLTEDETESYSTPSLRRASVLSHDEENLMDAILGGDDF